MVIKPGDPPPPPSVSTQLKSMNDIARRREWVETIIAQYDRAGTWDGMKSKDVPAEIVNHVLDELRSGKSHYEVRRELGIIRNTDKSWQKIMAAIRQGYRIDGTAYLVEIGHQYRSIANKMYEAIHKALDEGVQVPDSEGGITIVKGPNKELSTFIDAYNRLNQGFIKNGKDLGAFVERDGGPAGGVTIVVKTNVPTPSAEQIKAHQDKKLQAHQEKSVIDVTPEKGPKA